MELGVLSKLEMIKNYCNEIINTIPDEKCSKCDEDYSIYLAKNKKTIKDLQMTISELEIKNKILQNRIENTISENKCKTCEENFSIFNTKHLNIINNLRTKINDLNNEILYLKKINKELVEDFFNRVNNND